MAWTTPGTATAGEVLTAAFWNTQVRDNMIELAPLSAAWTSWTPNKTGSGWAGTFTFSASRYLKVGRMVMFVTTATFTGTGAGDGFILSLPVTAADAVLPATNLAVRMEDVGTSFVVGVGTPRSTTYVDVTSVNASGTFAISNALNNTNPFTWSSVNADKMFISGWYEAAS